MKVSEAVARTLAGSKVNVATYVPALGASQLFSDYCRRTGQTIPLSFHEEVAYTLAYGAALFGKRSVTFMKTHGVMKAANSLSDSLYSGTTAGFITMVVDDALGIQSDSIVDTAAFLKGLGIHYYRGKPETIDRDVAGALNYSEKHQLPVGLVIDASEINTEVPKPSTQCVQYLPPCYRRDTSLHMMVPALLDYQHRVLRAKANNCNWRKIAKPDLDIISHSLPEHWKPSIKAYTLLFRRFQD